jgi:hypothetical protein
MEKFYNPMADEMSTSNELSANQNTSNIQKYNQKKPNVEIVNIGGRDYIEDKKNGQFVPYYKSFDDYMSFKKDLGSSSQSESLSEPRSQETIDKNFHAEINPEWENSPEGTQKKYFIRPNNLQVNNDNEDVHSILENAGRGIASIRVNDQQFTREKVAPIPQESQKSLIPMQNVPTAESLMSGIAPSSSNQLPSTTENQGLTQSLQNVQSKNEVIAEANAQKSDLITGKFEYPEEKKVQESVRQKVQAISARAPVSASSDYFKQLIAQTEKDTIELSEAKKNGQLDLAKQAALNASNNLRMLEEISNREMAAKDKYLEDLKSLDDHIYRNRLWDSMPITNKFVAGISLFASALNPYGKNQALETFQNEMEKDIQRQKIEYDRKRGNVENEYAKVAQFYKDEGVRYSLTKAVMADALLAKASEIEAGNIPMQTKVSLDQWKAQLESQRQINGLDAMKKMLDIQNSKLEGEQKIIGMAKTKQDMTLKEQSLYVPTQRGMQKAYTTKAAESINKTIPLVKDFLGQIDKTKNLLESVNRIPVGAWRDSLEKLDIAKTISTLRTAQKESPDARLPLAEIDKMEVLFAKMSDPYKITAHKGVYLEELTSLRNEAVKKLSEQYKQSGLEFDLSEFGGSGER